MNEFDKTVKFDITQSKIRQKKIWVLGKFFKDIVIQPMDLKKTIRHPKMIFFEKDS